MFAGSRTTPTVDGEHVYTVGAMGDLYAINTTTQKPAWHKNIWTDFGGGELPRWAIVQNPLIYRDLLIVAPQTPQAGVVAYDKLTGAIRWKSPALSGIAGYVTPVDRQGRRGRSTRHGLAAVGSGRNAQGRHRLRLRSVSGKCLWTYNGWQCIIPVPQAVDAGRGPRAPDGRL